MRLWLAELNERQRTVIERRYGLNGRDVATLEELAREIGVTRERVRQIQAEALEKLRVATDAPRPRPRRAALERRSARSRRARNAARPAPAAASTARCKRRERDARCARSAPGVARRRGP